LHEIGPPWLAGILLAESRIPSGNSMPLAIVFQRAWRFESGRETSHCRRVLISLRTMHHVALIGLGLAAGPHVQSLKDLSGRVRVAAGFSRSAVRRDGFAARTNLPVTDNLDAIFADPAIDMVAILTPPASHLELVERASRSGKHILLEKPLDITTERSERL